MAINTVIQKILFRFTKCLYIIWKFRLWWEIDAHTTTGPIFSWNFQFQMSSKMWHTFLKGGKNDWKLKKKHGKLKSGNVPVFIALCVWGSESVSHTLVVMAMTEVERERLCSLWGKHWFQRNSIYNSENTWSLWDTMWDLKNRWT
jgi:hypothetical protein